MKKFIGLISLFILVLLLVSSISVGAYDNSATPMIEVGSLACNKGDVVSVPIYMSNNPGVTSVNLKIEYNSDYLNLIDIEDGKLLGEAVHSDDYEANPYTLSWENDTATENFLSNGTIATIKFEVAENSPAGRYDIFITSDKQLDCEGQIVDFTIVSGAIDVKENKLGDANGDGVLDTKDRIHISRYVADWKDYRNIDTEASDVTCDGIVDSEDRMYVSRHLAKWKDYKQFSYKSNGKIFNLKGVVLESSDCVSTNPSTSPYVMVNITNVMGNKYGIGESGNEERKMYVGISGAENFIGREVLLFVIYNEYDDTITIKSVYEVTHEKMIIDIEDICELDEDIVKYYVDDTKTKTVSVSSSGNWYYNNVQMGNAFAPDLYDIMNMNGTIELSLLNDETTDGDYDTVHITAYDVFVVDEVNATSKVVRSKVAPVNAPSRIKYDESNGDIRATLYDVNGAKMDWADLKEYDVLMVKYVRTGVKDICEAKIVENIVTGTVTGISGMIGDYDRYVVIDGKEYKVAFNAEDEKYIKLGDSGTFYLDAYDNVVYHTTVKNNNYAFVVDTNVGDAFDGAKIKLLTKESDIVDLEFANKISVWYKGEKASNISIDNLDELYYYGYEFKELRGMNIDDLEGMLVTYTLNNAGLITSIEIPAYGQTEDYLCISGNGKLSNYDITNSTFKLDGSRLYVTDDTVIFYAPKNGSTEDFVVLDIADLSHDQSMTDAYVYDVDDDRNIGAIIVKGDIIPGTEEPPAIPSEIKNATFVTNVACTVDEEGYDVIRVTGYNGLEEVSYICEETDVRPGMLVTPIYTENGDIDYFNVVGGDFSITDDYEEVAYGNLSPVYEDDEYISPINSRRKSIIVNGEEYKVDSSTNIYVYDETLSTRVKYRVGEYLEYVEFDIWDPRYDDDYVLYIDGEESYADVDVYMYIYNGKVVDLVYYIYK